MGKSERDEDGKKKKRKSEGGDSPKKSRKSEGGGVSSSSHKGGGEGGGGAVQTVTVRVCKEADNTTGSMLACFADAPPPFDHMKKDGGISFECGRGPGGARSLSGESGNLTFEGEEVGSGGTFKYLIGLYDPEKNEVVVADPGKLGNVVQLKRGVKSVGGGRLGEMTKEQARDALVDGFGSKRVKTTHRKRKGHELEKEGGESIGSLRTELEVKKEEHIAAGGLAAPSDGQDGPSDLAPKCNVEAGHPGEVYSLYDVIGESEWEALPAGQILDMAKNPSGELALSLPSFIRGQLSVLMAEGDKKERRKQAKLLMYAAFLMLFNSQPSRFNKSATDLEAELGCPQAVASRLLSDYAERSDRGYSRPQSCRDRLVLSLCVVSLMFARFQLDFTLLASDLKLHPDKLVTYFKEVGCVVTKPKGKDSTGFMAKLTAPPTFPKRSRGPVKK